MSSGETTSVDDGSTSRASQRSNTTTPHGESQSSKASNSPFEVPNDLLLHHPQSSTTTSTPVDRQAVLEQKMNGLLKTLEPFVHQLDEHVTSVRTSQELLNQELNHLLQVLHQIKLQESIPGGADITAASSSSSASSTAARHRTSGDISADLEEKSRRLLGLKRRLTLVHSILQTVNSRTKKLLLAHNSRISTTSNSSSLQRSSS